MKADKAVCTTVSMTDAESAISYENLLSTLVQKKILAIKHECETKKMEKQRRKQQNCLNSLIFGKRHVRSNKQNGEEPADEEMHSAKASISQQVIVVDSKEDSIERIPKDDDDKRSAAAPMPLVKSVSDDVPIKCAQEIVVSAEKDTVAESESTECQMVALNEHRYSEEDNNSTQMLDEFRSVFVKHDTKDVARVDNKNQQNVIRIASIENANTQDQDSTNTATASKSPSIVSQIEVSDEISPKQTFGERKDSSDTISVPSSIRLLEAKSISAQCSPIFTQRQTFNGRFLLTKHFSGLLFLKLLLRVSFWCYAQG